MVKVRLFCWRCCACCIALLTLCIIILGARLDHNKIAPCGMIKVVFFKTELNEQRYSTFVCWCLRFLACGQNDIGEIRRYRNYYHHHHHHHPSKKKKKDDDDDDGGACDCIAGLYEHRNCRVCIEKLTGRKIPCRIRDSNPRQYCAWLFSRTLYQLNYPDPSN